MEWQPIQKHESIITRKELEDENSYLLAEIKTEIDNITFGMNKLSERLKHILVELAMNNLDLLSEDKVLISEKLQEALSSINEASKVVLGASGTICDKCNGSGKTNSAEEK